MIIVVAALTVTGCATEVAGVAQPVGAANAGTQTTTTSELGDGRTINPCQFVADDTFKTLTPNEKTQVSTVTFGSCFLSSVFSDNSQPPKITAGWILEVQLGAGLNSAADYKAQYGLQVTPQQVNGRTVYEGSNETYGCVRGISLSGGQAVMAEVRASQANAGSDPCPIADVMATGAIAILKEGGLKHVPFPPGSAGDVDMCASLTDIASKTLGGTVTTTPTGLFGCEWTSPSRSIASVSLTTDTWPPQVNLGTPQQTQAGAHAALYTPLNASGLASGYCQVQYNKSPFDDSQFEVLTANVTIPGQSDVSQQTVQFATAVAAAVDAHH